MSDRIVGSPDCRKCGRRLVDQSDLWAGLCNNDDLCAERVRATQVLADEEHEQAWETATAYERAAVVTWLRDRASAFEDASKECELLTLASRHMIVATRFAEAADAIERGEHVGAK